MTIDSDLTPNHKNSLNSRKMQHNPNRRLTIVSADAFLPPNPPTQPPASTRRKSIYAIEPDRYATPVSRFSPDNITKYDVDCAFEILSKDGKKITKDDIFLFIERFFPSAPNKLPKLAISSLTTREATPQANEEGIESFHAEGMEIVAAGSFNKKDMAILTKRKEEEKAQASNERGTNDREQIKRVKAKKVK